MNFPHNKIFPCSLFLFVFGKVPNGFPVGIFTSQSITCCDIICYDNLIKSAVFRYPVFFGTEKAVFLWQSQKHEEIFRASLSKVGCPIEEIHFGIGGCHVA